MTAERGRLPAIDVLRGVLMALMALDHTRHFLSDSLELSSTNLATTTPGQFLTRWVTHFCAPGFVFLAGTGVYLYARDRPLREVSRFLLLRGLWLVLLELTVVRCLGWSFNFDYGHVMAGVLWAIGWSMVVLALLIHLDIRAVAAIGIVIIASHNLFDDVRARAFGPMGWLWTILHRTGHVQPLDGVRLKISYPVLPWIGVLAVGYAFGPMLDAPADVRRRRLMWLGAALTLAFVALRALNVYGDPRPWSVKPSALFTVFSFLHCDKYPPSLCFLLMTLGPLIFALGALDRPPIAALQMLHWLGRAPLFFYLLHIPLIHLVAVVLARARYGHAEFLFQNPPAARGPAFPLPDGYGYPLWLVYLIWIALTGALALACRWYGKYKQAHPSRWMTYLL